MPMKRFLYTLLQHLSQVFIKDHLWSTHVVKDLFFGTPSTLSAAIHFYITPLLPQFCVRKHLSLNISLPHWISTSTFVRFGHNSVIWTQYTFINYKFSYARFRARKIVFGPRPCTCKIEHVKEQTFTLPIITWHGDRKCTELFTKPLAAVDYTISV